MMITLKDALEKINQRYTVGGVVEYRDFWVFGYSDERDCSPIAVKKETGEMFSFFPPQFVGKDIGDAKVIDIASI
ncbi:MAG: hypothetical protein IJH79_04465 [Lentisphaeria bacterium]|nr:hypothetical protein [Lentisphaeria bacterium]